MKNTIELTTEKNMMHNKIKNNIPIDYIFCFIRNFDICNAIWVLYMVYRGLPLWQIGIAEGIFHVASFLFEVPSGALADLFGRKKVMILGRICYGVAGLIQLMSHSLFGFCIAFIISAFSYNLNSGSEEALVYDSMKAVGNEKGYMRVNSRQNILIQIAWGISVFVGGVLAEYSYVWCYGVAIFITVLSIIPACMLQEPPAGEKKEASRKIGMREHLGICISLIKSSRKLMKVLLYFPLVSTFSAVIYFYGQQYYAEMGFNKVQISGIMFLCGAAGCLGAFSSEKLMVLIGGRVKYLASVVMGGAILITCAKVPGVSIAAFVLISYCGSLMDPIQSFSLNVLIPSEQRATLISVQNMFFSLFMICLFPISGFAATLFTLRTAFAGVGLLQLLIMAVVFLYLVSKGRKADNGKKG